MASSAPAEPGSETSAQRLARLKNFANDFPVDKKQPLRRYYHSGHQMLKMGDTYFKEGNFESAYILYLKFLTLFIEKVTTHPEYKTMPAVQRNKMNPHIKPVMVRSESLKQRLKEQYDEEHKLWQREQEERRREQEERDKKRKELEGAKLRDQLGHYHEEKERTIAMQSDYEAALLNQFQWDKEEALKRSRETARVEEEIREAENAHAGPAASAPPMPEFDRGAKPSSMMGSSLPPAVPSRSSKPSSASSASARTNAHGLRTLVLPSALMEQFLQLAAPNTVRNVETCAILGGKLENDVFTITHLLVPKQKGTSDSCTMADDDDLFDYQLQHDLLTLGWIHTHPTQTAFLSSVDLHNHYGYQVMLPEAVAIVCAPKYKETGYFVLTQGHGMEFIGNCNEKGFHPHPNDPPLFEEGGHISEAPGARVKVVDLR